MKEGMLQGVGSTLLRILRRTAGGAYCRRKVSKDGRAKAYYCYYYYYYYYYYY